MTIVPNFILKRLYKKGTLRQEADGVAFETVNCIGPGSIVGVNHICLNGVTYAPEQIVFQIEGEEIPAHTISSDNPAFCPMNKTVINRLKGATLEPGPQALELDMISQEGGHVVLKVEDQIES